MTRPTIRRLFIATLAAATLAVTAAPALAAPDTTITSGPSGQVTEHSATFEFTGTSGAVGFRCRLDESAFEVCASPKTYEALETGGHTFEVAAFDTSGQDETPAVRTWEIVNGDPVPIHPTDPCPDEPDTAPHPGCTPGQLVTQPAAAMAPAENGVEASRTAVSGDPGLVAAATKIDKSIDLVARAGAELAEGEPCDAEQTVESAEKEIGLATDLIDKEVAQDSERASNDEASQSAGDVQELDMAAALTRTLRSQALAGFAGVTETEQTLHSVCEAVVGPIEIQGLVRAVDDANRTFQLEDGSVGFWAIGPKKDALLQEGSQISASGFAFDDGSIVATDADSPFSKLKDGAPPCLALRIAPAGQPLAPYFEGPYTFHSPAGYRVGSRLQLEWGMSFGVEDLGCPAVSPTGDLYKYTAKLRVKQDSQATHTLAYDLRPGEDPVPSFVRDTGEPATLEVSVWRRTCSLGPVPQCSPMSAHLSTADYDFVLREQGSYAEAGLDETAFSVTDDNQTGDYETTFVDFAGTTLFTGDGPVEFQGQAYAPDGSRSVVEVGVGDSFAIYEDDFHPGETVPPYDTQTFWYRQYGQVIPNGLRWARVEGTRNGAPFSYVASVPQIARDKVADCETENGFHLDQGPENPNENAAQDTYPPYAPNGIQIESVGDSFYKLPFEEDFSPGFGLLNIDSPKYDSRHPDWHPYAVDLTAPMDTKMLAARGGRVIDFVEEDKYQRSDPDGDGPLPPVQDVPADWPYQGNYLVIQHEDNTYGVYFHMDYQGVHVEIGDRVHRGDWLGDVGTTGYSSGPHVHFGVHNDVVTNPFNHVERIRYQALVKHPGGQPFPENCYIPRHGDAVWSTNGWTGS